MRLQVKKHNKIKANKTLILFGFILSLIFLQLLLFSPNEVNVSSKELKTAEQIKQLAESQKSNKSIEQKMKGIHFLENTNNQKGWELFAEEAEGSAEARWVLKKVKIDFYAEDQSHYKVSGDVGEIDATTKNILIRGNVVTESLNGYIFSTTELKFISNEKILRSQSAVEMSGPDDQSGKGFHLNGLGFRIDLKKNKMFIESNVEAEKIINLKLFQIKSNMAEFSNKTQQAQFSGLVNMDYDKMNLKSPRAVFNYSGIEKKLKTISLSGGVQILELEKNAICKEVEIDLEQDKMTLKGAPKVQMGDDEIVGDEIVFLDGGKKVKVNNVRAKRKNNELIKN